MNNDSFDLLLKNISSKVELSESDMQKIVPFFKTKTIKKKKDLLRNGDVCKELAFVVSGALRSYSVDEKGIEHVLQIALENYWISDLQSFLTNNPSDLDIEAIEDTEVLLISSFDLDRIYLEVPLMERFFRKLFENAYINTLMRLNSSQSESADIRYKKLLSNHPNLLKRIPLIYIASYLGITPESLSRIRKNAY
jgi:CRP-like cAMP-binding protein